MQKLRDYILNKRHWGICYIGIVTINILYSGGETSGVRPEVFLESGRVNQNSNPVNFCTSGLAEPMTSERR